MGRLIREGGPPRRVVPAEALQARHEADGILGAARTEAERVMREARDHAARVRMEAEAAGRRDARAEAARVVVEATRTRDRILRDAQDQVLRVAMAVARRIVGDQLAADPAAVRALAGRALDHARRARQVTLRIHPDDADAVAPLAQDWPGTLTVVPDATLTRGDCLLHTDVGDVDARLHIQLAALERTLHEAAFASNLGGLRPSG
jgi:flagellar assembly protein FliH